jgi:multidrug efflux pump
MNLPELCLRRPVFAAVANLVIIAIGLVAATRLPVRELPDIDAAQISIRTDYRGAAPQVMDSQVTEIIEAAVAGVAGVDSIESSSEQGDSVVRVRFVSTRDIDDATNDIRGAVGRVTSRLPEEAGEPRIYKNDADADPIMRIGITSTRWSAAEITDYADRYLVDRLATLDGVASVGVNGGRRYAMRIRLDPKALAARQLAVTDVVDALRANNVELPAGEVESVMRNFQLRADTRLATTDEFASVVLKVVDGAPVRLGDVATVEIGVENENSLVRSDGRVAVGLNVVRQSQSNTIAISDAVRAEIEALRPTLPEGMEMFVGSDDAIFIKASILEVVKTLAIAVALVVLVIFLFLGSPRATIVPAVVIPVALIGALIGIFALGYSINILTLFAMILAIGIVVDDAIVVLENIQRRIEQGQAPIAAAALGSREVGFAVIATSLTLISVFTPISFLEGQVGRLFTEFGITLAIAVIFSTFVALTLTPVLCWKLLRHGSGGALERGVNAVMRGVESGYRAALGVALRAPIVVLALACAFAGSAVWLHEQTPRELAPKEDRGVFFVSIRGPQGATLEYMDRETREVEAALERLAERGEVVNTFSLVGRWDPNRSFVVGRLVDWSERERSAEEIVRSIRGDVTAVPGARAFPITPSGLGLRGSRTPLQVKLLGPDFASVQEWSDALLAALRETPGLENLEMDYEETQPEMRVSINRPLADDLGVSILDAAATMQTMFASREATTYLERGREYPVILQAREEARRTVGDLAEVFVRSRTTGALIPLAALVSVQETTASPELNRFNRLPAIEISAALADGYDLGAAIEAVRAAAAETLPPEAQIAFDGQSKEYLDSSSGGALTLVLALALVYLVLAAQFESFIDPLTILLSAPLAATGALAAIWFSGQSINIYTQVGMLLLLGLMAKNGILIVEFANQLRDRGASVREAALEGSVRRLRPILMTVISTLLGAAPLVWSSGAGAESRGAIGIVILGGFGIASLLTLFVTPVLYDLLAGFAKPRAATADALDKALAAERATRTAAE